MTNDFSGKVVLITGASSGIGKATAILLAGRGAKLSLTGRNEVNLRRVGDECVVAKKAEQPLIVVADQSSEADVARLVDATIKKFGRLDVLVNNAGCVEFGSIETTSLAQYDLNMNTNVRSVYHLTMLCVPHLIAARGNIVNLSSLFGARAYAGALAYSMSKAAIDQMTSCMALELASKGVRVNGVNPGTTSTPIFSRAGMSDDQVAQLYEHQKEVLPLGRIGDPDDIARAIAFLASSDASFITGEHLHVDGGWHATCAR